jgi:hypothetical protein
VDRIAPSDGNRDGRTCEELSGSLCSDNAVNLRLEKWRATFAVRREQGTSADAKFVFNATDLDDYDAVAIPHRTRAFAPYERVVDDGHKE